MHLADSGGKKVSGVPGRLRSSPGSAMLLGVRLWHGGKDPFLSRPLFLRRQPVVPLPCSWGTKTGCAEAAQDAGHGIS